VKLFAFGCLILLNLLSHSRCLAQNRAGETPLKPLTVISGADSHIKKPLYKRVTTQTECNSIWANHFGTTADDAYRPQLEVDFDRCMVIMIFRGDQVNNRGIDVSASSEARDAIVIRLLPLTYQTFGENNKKPPDRPYALIVLPKSNKRIVIAVDVGDDKNKASEWKEIAKL
jgi:hypothetical protein